MGRVLFGLRAGMIQRGHKDTFIRDSAQTTAQDTRLFMYCNIAANNDQHPLMRFNLVQNIPRNARVRRATLNLYLNAHVGAGAMVVSVYKMRTAWGPSKTQEGATETPATGGQATYDEAFDYNGAADVAWASGGDFSAADYEATPETTFTVGAGDALGTQYQIQIPNMVQDWVGSDNDNNGLLLLGDGAAGKQFDAQQAAAEAVRPWLQVDFWVPSHKWYNGFSART